MKAKTICSSPRPASRELKAEAYQWWYSSSVGPPCLDLYCTCTWKRPFIILLEEGKPEAQVPDSPWISYTSTNHSTSMLLHLACSKVLPGQNNHIFSCCEVADGDLRAQHRSFLYVNCSTGRNGLSYILTGKSTLALYKDTEWYAFLHSLKCGTLPSVLFPMSYNLPS